MFGVVPTAVDNYPAGHVATQAEESEFSIAVVPEQAKHC